MMNSPAMTPRYDTPLTMELETEALMRAGFSGVSVMRNRGAAYTIVSKV